MMLAEFAVKSGLLLAGGFAVAGTMRRGSAASRHAIWMATLVSVLFLPIATMSVWRLPLAVLPAIVAPASLATATARSVSNQPASAASSWTERRAPSQLPNVIPNPVSARTRMLTWSASDWAVSIWLSGVLLLLARIVAGVIGARR